MAGTVQFASFTTGDLYEANKESVNSHRSNVTLDSSDDRASATAREAHPDPPMEYPPSGGNRKQLMDEIASAGQSVLRRTTRPKSPGGTPIKLSRNRLTLNGNTDMFQRALISKFRSLHSTPIRHHSPAGADKSGSFDLSNAWSDINSSSTVYEDPDLSSTPPSTLAPQNHSVSSRGTCRRSDVVGPNSSTAV